MFGIFVNKKELAAEIAANIRNEIDELKQNLAGVEEQMQQNLRQERRRQMALESILENQDKILQALERQEVSPPLEALMSLAENFTLTYLSEPDTPESAILFNKLSNFMDCFDLALVSETGVSFDPEKHEACEARCVPDRRDGEVLEIVRPGFLLRGKVLRCATVVVNRHEYDDIGEGRPMSYDLSNIP